MLCKSTRRNTKIKMLPQVPRDKAFTLKAGNKTLGLNDNGMHYIIGFRNVYLARRVQYVMHPTPNLALYRGGGLKRKDQHTDIVIDTEAKLFIPKQELKGGPHHPLNDGGWHLDTKEYKQLLMTPFKYQVGLIMVTNILNEIPIDIEADCWVLEPNESFMRDFLSD